MMRNVLVFLVSLSLLSACSLVEDLIIDNVSGGDSIYDSLRDALMGDESRIVSSISSSDVVDFPIPAWLVDQGVLDISASDLGSSVVETFDFDVDPFDFLTAAELEELQQALDELFPASLSASAAGAPSSFVGPASIEPTAASNSGTLRFGSYRQVASNLEGGLGLRRDLTADFKFESASVVIPLQAPGNEVFAHFAIAKMLVQVGLIDGFRDPPGDRDTGFEALYSGIADAYVVSPSEAIVFSNASYYEIPVLAMCRPFSQGQISGCYISPINMTRERERAGLIPLTLPARNLGKVEQILSGGESPDAIFLTAQMTLELREAGNTFSSDGWVFGSVAWSVKDIGSTR